MSSILIISHADGSRRWQNELLARLKAAGHTVSSFRAPTPAPAARTMDAILAIESCRFGRSLASPSEPLPEGESGPADIVIDLTANATASTIRPGVPVLTLEFCGHSTFPAGLVDILAGKCLPELAVRLDGATIARGRPVLWDRLWLSRSCDDLLAGAISLLVQSVARFAAGKLVPITDLPARITTDGGFLRCYLPHFLRVLGSRTRQKFRLGRRPFYWQVAYRLIDGPGVAETGSLDGTPFTVLADDGHRFYADPFVFERDGRCYLFVEEFPYATGRGVISVAELGDDGTFGIPRVVLEEPHHLSYPQVFDHAGEIFMIPESNAAHELVLYRAERFPDRWTRDTVLMTGRQFNDATLLETDGRYWLLGTEKFGYGSASDTMAVYSAPSLRGPWVAHALNPIAVDHSRTRPGGAFIRQGDTPVLPVQNGSNAYGGGLGLMRLEQLDDSDVRFGAPRPINSGPAWARSGIHTLNRTGRVEVVDSAG
ncbi:glucosamine inositolphosphorylceramide transferase family protein [Mesorhizobium amorphae]